MAGGDGFEKEVESELTCPVCLGLFERPQRLDCEHSFCQKCLQKLVKVDSVMLGCPACRSVTTLKLPGFLGVARLPIDFRLSRLVEKYQLQIGPESSQEETDDDSPTPAVLLTQPPVEVVPFEHIELTPCSEVIHGYVQFDLPISRTSVMFDRWKRDLWLCPTDFPDKAVLADVRMVCVPFYVFSVKTQVDFKAEVSCPQDGRSTLSTNQTKEDVTSSRIQTPIMINNNDPCSNHPSRRWIHDAVGSVVHHKTTVTKPSPTNSGWGTWLWSAAKPILPAIKSVPLLPPQKDEPSTGCTAAPTTPPPTCSSSESGKKYSMKVDNLEMSTKVGQTYVSSTQPMVRNLSLSGRHNNSFTNMLVCSSHAIDHDLVAGLMTGHSKDEDLSLLTSIKLPPPNNGTNDEYLKKILEQVLKSSSVGGHDEKDKEKEKDKEGLKEKVDKKEKRVGSGAECSDPAVVYDELMSTPPMMNRGGLPEYTTYPSDHGREAVNAAFFGEDNDEADLPRSASCSSGSDEDEGEIPAPDTPADGAGRVLAQALQRTDYFAPANASSLPPPSEHSTAYGKPELLSPERRSEDSWKEQIWPHVQDKEISFTRSIIKSMEPKGATLEASSIELTVTELKQKAILVPCYLATYKYENKLYDVVIHGRTGEVHGKRPWLGSSAYDSVKREVEGQVHHVRNYLEGSLDHFGVK